MNKLRITQEQLSYIVEKTGIKDPKEAVIYFAEVMVMEKIHPSKMPECVNKMIQRERKRIK